MNKQKLITDLVSKAVDTVSKSEKIKNSCGDLLISETFLKEVKLKQGRITILVEIENVPGRNFDELLNETSKLTMEIQSGITSEVLDYCQ